MDTGVDVTVIPESDYQLERDGQLKPSSRVLSGPTQETLKVQGQFSGRPTRNGIETQQDIYVVSELRQALLGRPAIEALKVVSVVAPVQERDSLKKFPELFKGLGKLKDNYVIKLQEDAILFSLTYAKTSSHTPPPESEERAPKNGELGSD